MSRFDLTGRAAVVTGGLGRLGPLWAEALLDAGAHVALLDLPDATPSPTATALLEAHGSDRLGVVQADVTDRASVEHACTRVESMFGVTTVLVNNAGLDQPPAITASKRLEDIELAAVEEVLRINAGGVFVVMQVFGSRMIAANGGSIINIGSLYASVSPDQTFYNHLPVEPPFIKPPAYGASKAALVNLTRYFATHWAVHGIRVNALSPGGVAGDQDDEFVRKFTARVPLGRLADPEDLSGPLVFLASDAASYVTGINLEVDGGFTAW